MDEASSIRATPGFRAEAMSIKGLGPKGEPGLGLHNIDVRTHVGPLTFM